MDLFHIDYYEIEVRAVARIIQQGTDIIKSAEELVEEMELIIYDEFADDPEQVEELDEGIELVDHVYTVDQVFGAVRTLKRLRYFSGFV